MAVVINSGPVDAEDLLRHVPREKWRELMLARRRFCEIKLSYDCRCLVQFVADADVMHSALGYESAEAMIRDGYGLELKEIAIALEWLKLNPPKDPIPLEAAKQLAAAAVMKDARPVGQHGGDRKSESRPEDQPSERRMKYGETAAYLASRIKKKRPDIAAAVERGEYRSMRAAAIAAGIVTPPTPLEIILKQLPKLTDSERRQLVKTLLMKQEAA